MVRGVRRKVSSNTKIPGRWLDFLRDSRNKIELFSFLTLAVSKHSFPEQKSIVYITEEVFISLKKYPYH